MKNKPKAKAIHAELRKESKKFEGWLKYEVTIQYPNGETEQVPAYGKDLQDALSRVVHDQKIEKIEKKFLSKISETGWVLAWFLGLAFAVSSIYYHVETEYAGWWIIGMLFFYSFFTLSVNNWFQIRNKDK